MRLNHSTLPSKDVTTGATFYQRLGFRGIVDAAPDHVRLEAPEGGAALSFMRLMLTMPAASPVFGYPAVSLETPDVDALCARLRQVGVAFDGSRTDQSWLWRKAWLRDPDGNRIGR